MLNHNRSRLNLIEVSHQKYQRGHMSEVNFWEVVSKDLPLEQLSFSTKLFTKSDTAPTIYPGVQQSICFNVS